MTIVNESGLYQLIFQSRKPEAKKFTKWVTGEVLPSIRKTGSYSASTVEQLELFPRHTEGESELLHLVNIYVVRGDIKDLVEKTGVSRNKFSDAKSGARKNKVAFRLLVGRAIENKKAGLQKGSTYGLNFVRESISTLKN